MIVAKRPLPYIILIPLCILFNSELYSQEIFDSSYVKTQEVIYFESGEHVLSDSHYIILDTFINRINQSNNYHLHIDAHTVALKKITDLGYNYEIIRDTSSSSIYNHSYIYYKIREVILIDESIQHSDNIKNINFTLRELKPDKCQLEIINIELPKPGNIQDWRNLKRISKNYKNRLKNEFVTEIKN